MALSPETPFEDVLVKLKKAREGSDVRQVAEVVLKKGPRAFKTAGLLEVINKQTGELHHHTLVLEQVKFTKKNGWEYEGKHKITLEDKDAQEIHDLFVFLNAHYSGELEDKVGKVRVLSEDAYAKHERLIQLIPGLEEEEKFGLIGQLLANVEGVQRAEFNKLFAATGGETLRHIAASSRMVEYRAAHEEMVALVGDPESSEHDFQKHLDKNPWMFGSEYSELLSRRNWTRDDELDYMLRRTVDGYLEIVEIKTAFLEPLFLHDKSHDSYYPSSKLSKAIGQVMRYIDEVERNRDSIIAKDNVDTLKIKARVIVGRDGAPEQQAGLRNFNAHLHGIEVITFDQLLKIAERVLSMFEENRSDETKLGDFDDDIPF